ncbi:hypothetical protein QR680_005086 [Steinernema hermaphroditum]|uniref:Uncharacterized protein n=1 Tax=Steinernema hermaphroditum TaxID=289476 RepID=A0AA39LUQ7_9BILA|nr:hypothetical protein QR680_005086 [Steinernema hermaphroditum]
MAPHLEHFDFRASLNSSLFLEGADGMPVTASLLDILIRKPELKSRFIGQIDEKSPLLSTLQMSAGARAPINAHNHLEEKAMRSREYTDGPGEIDMLIGFFLMNGMCIVFFLLFGMCVICSCMRRRPRFNKAAATPRESFAAAQKPSFRGLVSKAVTKNLLDPKDASSLRRGSSVSIGSAKKGAPLESGSKRNSVCFLESRIRIETEPDSMSLANVEEPKLSPEEEKSSPMTEVVEVPEPSLIRQNLLGPLSFDDLYYT